MLDNQTKEQLMQYMELIEQNVVFKVSVGDDENSKKTIDFVNEVAALSDKIAVEKCELSRTPSFAIDRAGESASGVMFAGLPLGHEFTSFIMALLQVSGRKPKIEDDLIAQIKKIDRKLDFTTYISLTCNNCPEVVQSLNIMAVLNPNITHTMVEGSFFQSEIDAREIMTVPTMTLDGNEFASGRMDIEQILNKLGVASVDASALNEKEPFDVLVVGGGPAGSSAAIYAARKGIRTGMVVERMGGQVMETLSIENIIGTKYTEGEKFMAGVEAHIKEYPVDIIKAQRAVKLAKNDLVEVTLENGSVLKSKTMILATGARWRNINVPGEQEFKNKGVAYCPHCDGPLFKGKDVAVIGGGNSGVEAAIDLAGVVNSVTLIEFATELKADKVLQDRLKSLKNVTIVVNALTKEIGGTSKVESITYEDRDSGNATTLDVSGVFILVGLQPNTNWIDDSFLDKSRMGEIVVDKNGATKVPGIFAAGDCTDSTYKQIVISIGTGATAALSAFDYLIRN